MHFRPAPLGSERRTLIGKNAAQLERADREESWYVRLFENPGVMSEPSRTYTASGRMRQRKKATK
jgi:hypothetical protein